MLKKSLIICPTSKANKNQVFVDNNIRITYLTSKLIRVETGCFTDLASYAVWNRQFPAGKMDVNKDGSKYIVKTEDIIFTIKKGVPYSVTFLDTNKTEILSKQHNLKGTYRTLDGVKDRVALEDGFVTKAGAYLFDDSKSILIDKNGMFTKRDGGKDFYVFAYGKDYRGTIKALFSISQNIPLVPRFALGVWWSRYHAYTQKEYLDLMDRFAREEIPLTVATVDMDWHWVDIKKHFGKNISGWTGYSWDKTLFPDYKEFLKELKQKNLHVTLNLHPADGVRPFEDMYTQMAKANGKNPESEKTISFKCGSDIFWNSYFDVLHKPYEKDGVDFWWIDWQQGKHSDVAGLDPLKALNHFHYLDNAENGDIPLILSRYGGIGSHRYPLGFSGDTHINWEILDFVPYFTANAANVGYGWWSHDIGGHHFGYRDDDLYLRWLQFGTFSPVMRLHSTARELLGKEPWKYRQDVFLAGKWWLNFRHSLIPYIFSMNHRCHKDGVVLCEPMYYSFPNDNMAYDVPNQYMFGSELMVCPITTPQHKENGMGSVKAWIPSGEYTDIFTNQKYVGPKMVTLNRELYTIPVLAKAGAVVPISKDKGNSCENPKNLELWLFKGNNTFVMYEDNGKTDFENHTAKTIVTNCFDEKSNTITVKIKVEGDLQVIPKDRKYTLCFKDVANEDVVVDFSTEEIVVTVENIKPLFKETPKDMVINAMSRWQEKTETKDKEYRKLEKLGDPKELLAVLPSLKMPDSIKSVIIEYLTNGD